MRVAVAGTNGLAYWLAYYLAASDHQFFLLSRAPKPRLEALGWQVIVVDYSVEPDLTFKLAGVDIVISMITGDTQLSLINAALHAGVRRFIPAEFGGSPHFRSATDVLDRGHAAALTRLQQCVPRGMAFTIVSCGILYERFGPGGMQSANIGQCSGASGEGDYLTNIRTMRARLPYDTSQDPATICMTAAQDVGQSVVAAFDLPQIPTELRICGERRDVSAVVEVAELMRERLFEREEHNAETLQHALNLARSLHNGTEQLRIHLLIATLEGRFDFADANLNEMIPMRLIPFDEWLRTAWAVTLG